MGSNVSYPLFFLVCYSSLSAGFHCAHLCSNMRKIQSEWMEMGGGRTVFLYSSAQNRGWSEGELSDPFCNLIRPQRGNINTRPGVLNTFFQCLNRMVHISSESSLECIM